MEGTAEQIVNRLLAEQGVLLTSAIMAVIGALRVNPDKYNIIFDNTEYNDNNSTTTAGSWSTFIAHARGLFEEYLL